LKDQKDRKESKKDPKKNLFKSIINSKNFKYGSISTASTVLVIVCAVILNLIINVLSERYQLKLDLTSGKSFEISNESIDFLKDLNKDIQMDVLEDENNFKTKASYTTQVYEILKQYSKYSDHIKLNFIDAEKDPSYASKFPREKLEPGMIVLSYSSEEYVTLSPRELFNVESAPDGSQKAVSSKAEQEITSAILNVTQKNKPKVKFISGYEEEEMPEFESLLQKNGYEVQKISIVNSDIPDDTDIAVILGSSRDYMPESVEKLEKFLGNNENYGKSIIYAANPQVKSLKNLESFFEKYGIKVENGITFETNQKALFSDRNYLNFSSSYVSDVFTKNIKSTKIPICIPSAKSLTVTNKDNVKVLTQSSKESGIMPLDRDKNWEISQDKFTGPIPTSLISSFGKSGDSSGKKSNIIVFGSYVIAKKELLELTHINNSEYLINAFKILSGNESRKITIESKSLESKQLGLKSQDSNVIACVFIITIPSIVLAICAIVLIKRKNL
jgi:hypothetical protein